MFPKIGVTPNQIIHFNRVFHYKPSILGYPYLWKHPYNSGWWNNNLFTQPDLVNIQGALDLPSPAVCMGGCLGVMGCFCCSYNIYIYIYTYLENLGNTNFFRQLRLALGVKLMEIKQGLFSRYILRKDKDGRVVPWVSYGVMKNKKMCHLLRAAGAFFLLSSMLFVSYHLIIDYDPSPYFVRKSKVVKKS